MRGRSTMRAAGALGVLMLLGAAPIPVPQPPPGPLVDAPLIAPEVLLLGLDGSQRMTVPVSVADATRYPFVVDTGSERTVLSRELAAALRLPAGPRVTLLSMTGRHATDSVLVTSLALGNDREPVSLIAPTLAGRNIGAAGIVGLDRLQDRRVEIDLVENTMAIHPSSAPPAVRGRNGDIIVRARSRMGQLILVDAEFQGQRLDVILDTGAQTSVGNLALMRRVAPRGRREQVLLTSVTGGTLLADQRRVGRLRLGGVEIVDLGVAFADAAPFRRLGLDDRPAMLLGMDALRVFDHVSIDFAARRVRLRPPAAALRQPMMGGRQVTRIADR